MPCPEFDECFLYEVRELWAIYTEFDDHAPVGHPGMIARVARVLVFDEDAEKLPEGAVLKRVRSGVFYEVKNMKRSGVGFTEIDLHRVDGQRFERTF